MDANFIEKKKEKTTNSKPTSHESDKSLTLRVYISFIVKGAAVVLLPDSAISLHQRKIKGNGLS